jgi:hypothetical protein
VNTEVLKIDQVKCLKELERENERLQMRDADPDGARPVAA